MTDTDACKAEDNRQCTCHPGDRPKPCMRKYASRECWQAAVLDETQEMIIILKGRDREPYEQTILNYLMRVRRAIE